MASACGNGQHTAPIVQLPYGFMNMWEQFHGTLHIVHVKQPTISLGTNLAHLIRDGEQYLKTLSQRKAYTLGTFLTSACIQSQFVDGHHHRLGNECIRIGKGAIEIKYDENLANNCYATSDGFFTLDGMASASVAFSMEDEDMNFTQKVYGLVTNGKLRLGIRNTTGTLNARWTLFDNFKLIFRGLSDTEGQLMFSA